MASTLGALPSELLILISEHLEEDKNALSVLSRVSHRLYDVASPILYRKISIDMQPPHRPPKLGRLIRTLNLRPVLAGSVKRLRFVYVDYPWVHGTDYRDGFERTCRDEIAKEVSIIFEEKLMQTAVWSRWQRPSPEYGVHPFERLLRDWEYCLGYEAAMGGLLLASLPCIEELILTMQEASSLPMSNPLQSLFGARSWNGYWNVAPDTMMDNMERLSPVLEGLHNVKYLHILGANIQILNLPFRNLGHISIDLVACRNGDVPYNAMSLRQVFRKYPGLKSLDIRIDAVHYVDMEDQWAFGLLGRLRCNRLKTLSFELTTDPKLRHDIIPDDAAPRQNLFISECFPTVASSLENFEVKFGDSFDPSALRFLAPTPKTRNMVSLKRMDVPQLLLVPWKKVCGETHGDWLHYRATQVLPPNLEELYISYPDENLLPWLEDLATVHYQLRNLRHITLRCMQDRGMSPSEFREYHSVLQAVRMTGIEINIIEDRVVRGSDVWMGTWSTEDWQSALFGSDS